MSDYVAPVTAILLPHLGAVAGGIFARRNLDVWYEVSREFILGVCFTHCLQYFFGLCLLSWEILKDIVNYSFWYSLLFLILVTLFDIGYSF